MLDTVKEEFTEVSSSGHPTAPKELVNGYAGQLKCILRSTVSINTENLRHRDRGNLRNLLFTKLHERYKFPGDFANTRLSGNKVNSAALTKMSTALATWRAAVKRRILRGDSYEKIKETNPSITPNTMVNCIGALVRRRDGDTSAIWMVDIGICNLKI